MPPRDMLVQIPCPLCGNHANVESDGTQVACQGCGLTFEPPKPEPKPPPVEEAVAPEVAPADALVDWLAGKPIETVLAEPDRSCWRWTREHTVATATIAVLVMVAVSVVAMAGYVDVSKSLARQQAELQTGNSKRKDLERQLESAGRKQCDIQQKSAQAVRDAQATWAMRLAAHSQRLCGDDQKRSLLAAAESLHATLAQGNPAVPQARQVLRDGLEGTNCRSLVGHTRPITSLVISPDSRLLASGSLDRTARLWDLAAADPSASSVVLEGHRGSVSDVAFSPNKRWLATGSFDTTARIWDLASENPTAAPLVLREHKGRIADITISRDGRWLITGSGGFMRGESTARLWDLASPDPAASSLELPANAERIRVVAISPNNRWLVTGCENGTALLWDLKARQPDATCQVLHTHCGAVKAVSFTSDNRFLVTGGASTEAGGPTLRLWDLTSGTPFTSIALDDSATGIRAAITTPDARRLFAIGEDNIVRVWDLAPLDPVVDATICLGETQHTQAMAISPDNRWLATGYADGTVRLWDLVSLDSKHPEACSVVLRGHEGPITALTISPDNHWLVSAGDDNTIRVWTLRANELIDLALEQVVSNSDNRKDNRPGQSNGQRLTLDFENRKSGLAPKGPKLSNPASLNRPLSLR
jgi:WD40 repeat protein